MDMRAMILFAVLALPSVLTAMNQFVDSHGGPNFDRGWDAVQVETDDFVVVGHTLSFGAGSHDAMLSVFDGDGIRIGSITLGGDEMDVGYSIVRSAGDFYITGMTRSFGAGDFDIFVSKFAPSAGVNPLLYQWTETFGGIAADVAYSIIETSFGYFAVAGRTSSYGAGLDDLLFARVDPGMGSASLAVLGGSGNEVGMEVIQASNGDYVVVGRTQSFGAGDYDLLLVRLWPGGALKWARTLGGSDYDEGWSVTEIASGTADEALIVVGQTNSYGYAMPDILISKFQPDGTHEWTRTLGDFGTDVAHSVIEDPTTGTVFLTGETETSDGVLDVHLTSFNPVGDYKGTWIFGGTLPDYGLDVLKTNDDGFFVTGSSESYSVGNHDFILAKYDDLGTTCMGGYLDLIPEEWDPEVMTPEFEYTTLVLDIITQLPDTQYVIPQTIQYCYCECGDANGDGNVTTGDGYFILNYFGGGPQPVCCWSANVNGDPILTTGDGYHLLNYFGSGPALNCAPCTF
jgi:hypothetical protein